MKLDSKTGSTNDEIRKFLSKGRAPIWKPGIGDRIRGTIAEPPKLLPLNEFGTKTPRLDDDGKPMQQLLLVLAMGEGKQRVYVDKMLMRDALWRAIEDSGADGLEVGGTVEIERVEDVGNAHNFEITYTPPSDEVPF